MKKLDQSTIDNINLELFKIPEQYLRPFVTPHEGYAVLLEEVEELKDEIFWGEKISIKQIKIAQPETILDEEGQKRAGQILHKQKIYSEATQVAAMAIRIMQECC